MAERIEMTFGIWASVAPWERALLIKQIGKMPTDAAMHPFPKLLWACVVTGIIKNALIAVFNARRYAGVVLAVVVCLCVRVSVSPSVTSRYCIKTATDRIT